MNKRFYTSVGIGLAGAINGIVLGALTDGFNGMAVGGVIGFVACWFFSVIVQFFEGDGYLNPRIKTDVDKDTVKRIIQKLNEM